jgi:hypothetical protein
MGTLRSIVGGLALATASAMGPSPAAEPVSLRSEGGHFVVRIAGLGHPERMSHLHGLDLLLTTADGKPAAGAAIRLTGQRRYAPNHLPTSPRVRPAGAAGHYRVEGLRFHIAGTWRLAFEIEAVHLRDRATFDVVVK